MAKKLKLLKPMVRTRIDKKSPISSQIDKEIEEWNEAEKLLDNSITIEIKDDLKYKTYKVLFYKKRIYLQYDTGTIHPDTFEYLKKDKILYHLYTITNNVLTYKTFMIFRLNKNKKFISDRLANLIEYLKGI